MGKSQLRHSSRLSDCTTRVAGRSLRIGVGSSGSNRVEIGSCILGFGDGACPRIHVPDVIRNAGRPGHLAPLALKGVSGVGTTLLFINDERTDALLERDLGGDLLDMWAEGEIVRDHRAGLRCRLAGHPVEHHARPG